MTIKTHLKSVICLVLTMLMVFSVVLSVSAAEDELAQTSASGTVYYENNTNWGTVYCYMWNGDGEQKNAEWPGQQMTKVSGNVWKYEATSDYQNVIFNNGSGGNGNQTADLTFPGANQIFDGSNWRSYSVEPTTPTTTPTPTTNPNPNPNNKYVYLKNTASWGSVYCYMWKDGSGDNQAWPGCAMENIGDNVWRYEVTGEWNMIIFNCGSDSQKTSDMSFPGANKIYDNSTGQWSDFDTSPIIIKSCGTDVEGSAYKGMEIVLSANATSTGGIVYYKFSVTNASGATTVLKDYSTATSATWTPTAAGTYTATFEFKDTQGNTNKRTATVSVLDDASIKEPIIKKVSPAPGQVKYNTNMNISVSAGGGKTGTNLLFYKYTVKDANGKVINVPYYTKSTSYTFKPTTQGKFTVTVSLQNSYNDILERTYEYDSVMSVSPTTTPSVYPTTTPNPSGLLGDVDRDGAITILDATKIQMHLAEMAVEIDTSVADYDKDGRITVLDATKIQLYLAES